MQLKKWGLAAGFCLIVTVVLATVKFLQIRAAMEMAASFPEPMETVEYTTVNPASWAPETSVIAETVAIQSVELRNELSGVIAAVYFKPGQRVEEGQLLVSQETSQEEARLAAIRADVKLAQAEYKRMQSVVARGAAPETDLDRAEATRDSLLADEQELIATINKKNIRAPFTARAGLHELEAGQYLNPGEYLADLVGLNESIWVDFSLPQQAATLRVGDTVNFSARGFIEGRKSAIIIARDAMADSRSRNVKYRAELANDDERLFAGMALVAHVNTAQALEGVAIPASALRYDTEGPYLFILNPIENAARGTHRAEKRLVEIGMERNQEVLVTSGLAGGEEIATLGSFKLRENLLVNAVTPSVPEPGEMAAQTASGI